MNKYAGYLPRFFAFLVDGIIQGIFSKIVNFLVPEQQFIQNPVTHSDFVANVYTADVNFAIQLVIGIVPLLFFAYLISTKGITPGKKLFGLCVKRENGKNLTMLQAILRELGMIVSALPVGLGFFWIFFDKRRQAWHDKFVGSLVLSAK